MPNSKACRLRLSLNATSVLLTACALAGCALLVALLPSKPMLSFPPYLVNYTSFDSGPQRLAHKLLLITLACCALLVLPLRRVGSLLGENTHRISSALAALRCLPAWVMPALLPVAFIVYQGRGKDKYLLGFAIALLIVLFGQRLEQIRAARLLGIVSLSTYAACMLLPGFYGPFPFGLEFDQSVLHYFGLLGLGPLLVQQSADILSRTSIFYGFLPQTILAMVERWRGPFTMGDYVLIVLWAQVAFTVLALACYRKIAPKATLWSLFCMCLWLPWINTTSASMFAPTQSGLRYLTYPCAVFVMLYAKILPPRALSLLLGACAGLALLYNLETGICVSLGLLAYLVLGESSRRPWRILGTLLGFIVGTFSAFVAFVLFFRAGLGYWPFLSSERLFTFLGKFAAGFAGLPLYFEVLLVPLLIYPAYLVIRLIGAWLARGLSAPMRFKFSVSMMILVWLAYFFNRAHPWNLWTHIFLFSFLIVDATPWRMPRRMDSMTLSNFLRAKITLGAATLVFILAPMAMNVGLVKAKTTGELTLQRIFISRTRSANDIFSGVWLGEKRAKAMQAQCEALLAEYKRSNRLVYASPSQLPLLLETGIIIQMPVQDIFNECTSEAEFQRMFKTLREYAPDTLLLAPDMPDDNDDPIRTRFNLLIEQQLAPDYVRSQPLAGWRVLRKVGTALAK